MDYVGRALRFAEQILDGEPSTHDIGHALRVRDTAMQIAREEEADLFVVELAALLHDVGIPREHREGGDHAAYGAELAREFLTKEGVSPDIIERVVECIRNHRFSAARDPPTLEAAILQDADRLDAMGAIGIFRALVSMGSLRTMEHLNGVVKESSINAYMPDPVDGFLDYIVRKPYLIPGRLNTETARRICEERLEIMRAFHDALMKETSK